MADECSELMFNNEQLEMFKNEFESEWSKEEKKFAEMHKRKR